MNVTDYTQPKSTIVGPILPSRFGSYMLDTIKSWLSDSRNILAPELKSLTYVDGNSEAAHNASSVYVDIEWPENTKLAGKTPAIIISYGEMTMNNVGTGIPVASCNFPGKQFTKQAEYSINIVVRTAAYAGTQYLSEMLFMYLHTFAVDLQRDSGVSKFNVMQLTPAQLSQSPGDSQDVFMSTIVCKVQSTFNINVDTTGPVFRRISLNQTI